MTVRSRGGRARRRESNPVIPTCKNQLNISGCSAVGSARALGARCRRFESCHSDQKGAFVAQRSDASSFLLRFQSSMFAFRKPNLVSPTVNVTFRPKQGKRYFTWPLVLFLGGMMCLPLPVCHRKKKINRYIF